MSATVGLTGGIACGKSTVARLFTALGVPVIDADELAREVVAPGTVGLREIVAAFGDGVLTATGALDRKKLGDIVFADAEARLRLEAITHPRIGELSARRIAEAASDATPYVLYEAALLVEKSLHRWMHALVVVTVDSEVQRGRLMARDDLDEAAARARIQAQWHAGDKLAAADFVIDNSGALDETRARVAQVHAALLSAWPAIGSGGNRA